MEERLIYLESEAERLRRDVLALRGHFNTIQELQALLSENQQMRQAILKYAIACGTVDIQVALLKSRHERTPELLEEIKRTTLIEEEASRALRTLAQELKLSDQERPSE